jgi:putative phosphoesterase
MRVALISDLHGNEVALEAVLADARGVDRLICLGDVATLGPRPQAILSRLADSGCDCILGNHDEFLLDAELIRRYTEAPIVVDSVDWCRAQLSQAELDFLRGFKKTLEVPLENGTLFLFHGSPRSHMEDLLAETPPERVDELLAGHRATVMAGGHTHIQMLRQHRGILLVNPGSLGMPFREYVAGRAPTVLPWAEYAVVESSAGGVSVSLRRVALDGKKLRGALHGSSLPLAPALLAHYANA